MLRLLAAAHAILSQLALQIEPIEVVALAAIGLYFISMLLSGLYLYVPEIYPTRMCALGVEVASAWLRIGAIVGPSLVGWILGASDLGGVFLMFAIAAAIGSFSVLTFAIETRGRVLEELAP